MFICHAGCLTPSARWLQMNQMFSILQKLAVYGISTHYVQLPELDLSFCKKTRIEAMSMPTLISRFFFSIARKGGRKYRYETRKCLQVGTGGGYPG